MGFTINEEITTTLHYKDICLIAVTFGEYQTLYKDTADEEILTRMRNLVNRLGVEMYNTKDDDNN
jgi:predicted SpoU family rRNA methylase